MRNAFCSESHDSKGTTCHVIFSKVTTDQLTLSPFTDSFTIYRCRIGYLVSNADETGDEEINEGQEIFLHESQTL